MQFFVHFIFLPFSGFFIITNCFLNVFIAFFGSRYMYISYYCPYMEKRHSAIKNVAKHLDVIKVAEMV